MLSIPVHCTKKFRVESNPVREKNKTYKDRQTFIQT